MTYFCPALDPPLDGSGRKTTTLVRDIEYFIHTKFHQNPSSGSGEEVENVNSLTDDGRRTDGRTTDGRRTDAGQRVITIGHWSLWHLCPKNILDPSNAFSLPRTIFLLRTMGKGGGGGKLRLCPLLGPQDILTGPNWHNAQLDHVFYKIRP